MKISSFIKRLLGKPAEKPSALTPEAAPKLAQALEHTSEEEYSCEDVYRLMDQYAEIVTRGEDPAVLMPLVGQHLELCSDCREELDALLRMIRGTE